MIEETRGSKNIMWKHTRKAIVDCLIGLCSAHSMNSKDKRCVYVCLCIIRNEVLSTVKIEKF